MPVEAPVVAPAREPEIKPGKIEPEPELSPETLCPVQKDAITRIIKRDV